MDPRKPSLPEAEAQRVLARAAEIDAQGGPSVPLERLRLAALEAGLTPAAFEAALAEVREARVAPLPPANPWHFLARYACAIVGTGVVLVAGASLLNDVESAWLVRKLLDPVALGLMIAGVAGVLLGSLLRRASGGPEAQPETAAPPVRESTPPRARMLFQRPQQQPPFSRPQPGSAHSMR